MFDNIINKLKSLAKIIFIIGIILSFLMIIPAIELSAVYLLIGVIIFFSFWASSLFVYAFAVLIEKIDAIENNTKKITVIQAQFSNSRNSSTTAPDTSTTVPDAPTNVSEENITNEKGVPDWYKKWRES